MRILYNSKELCYKTPFGTLTPQEDCHICIHIPASCAASRVEVIFQDCDGKPYGVFPLEKTEVRGNYELFSCTFRLADCGIYYYYFKICAITGPFRLFKQGNDTNMEDGEMWQLSCIPADFQTPDWAKGAVMYQIYPDRFFRKGTCDTTGKLEPFWLHDDWYEQPHYLPDEHGEVLNNDFFGGNFKGIQEKLPYLKSLGVSILYLNPVVMAYSNHRYDAADFKRPDPLLGTEEDYRELCEAAHGLGMRVIFDGVFSHTGNNSVYFDAKGIFGGGAVSDPDSPYRSWYQFQHYPDKYLSWWDFYTLPCVDKSNPGYINYIIEDEDSVLAHWMGLGVDGFRLDVVDELPEDFVLKLKRRIRRIRSDAFLIGEVWEDASNKIAYGVPRRYFANGELDSAMNYPWQKAIIRFLRQEEDGAALGEVIMTIAENYPPQVLSCVMNVLGTHDTPRILNALSTDVSGDRMRNGKRHLSAEERKLGLQRLRLAATLEFTLPGIACIYYGDEAGMEGFADPFNRYCFPWGREDESLQDFYRRLSRLKTQTPALKDGDVRVLAAGEGRIVFRRRSKEQTVEVCVNHTDLPMDLPSEGKPLFSTHPILGDTLPPHSAAVIQIR